MRINQKDMETRASVEFPGKDIIPNPLLEVYYEIDVQSTAAAVWPWIKQLGYHRGGWYIDTKWDKYIQKYFWPLVVPKNARGFYKPPADKILPEYQNLTAGDLIPDGPPNSAYYQVVDIKENQLLVLHATSHFKYMAPNFMYKTRFAPKGQFCWAFLLQQQNKDVVRLTSWLQAEAYPELMFRLLKPFFKLVDRLHQQQILVGIKRRVEKNT
ncbi:MAG: hypothetical protein HKN87_15365 [Saprospiraceae bacterium]|nr:hypothetical protein [Saprospiraceae bacterium]